MSKNIEVVKDKIKKLLAMAEDGSGASQSEVESAIKIARKLMYEYKIAEGEVVEKEIKIITSVIPEVTFSTTVNPWVITLLDIITKNYRCYPAINRKSGAKTRLATIIGDKDDVEIAKAILIHSFNTIVNDGQKIRRTLISHNYTNKDATSAINAYGNGFVIGIRDAIYEQNKTEQEEFGLVLSTPKNVIDYCNDNLGKSKFNTSRADREARRYDAYATKGYLNGKNYVPNKMIG